MEYKYMKKMAKTPKIDDEYNEPITETHIHSIEQQIVNKFPLAYREFLLLGGNGANMIADNNHEMFSEDEKELYWKQRQEEAAEGMAEAGFNLKKDYWAFADLGGEQFKYFHFDEGDDPAVHIYCSYIDMKDNKDIAGIEKLSSSFSEYINKQIDYRKTYGY